MSYAKKEFGARLKEQLTLEYDVVRIARWTHQDFLDHCIEIETDLEPEMMRIIAMEEGPEFEMTAQELQLLAEELQQ